MIPSAPGYFAGSDGSIIGRFGRPLKQPPTGKGYLCFRGPAETPGKFKTMSSHVAICEAWHGLRPVGLEVAHLNGNPADNRPVNLKWSTPRENSSHKRAHGTHLLGEQVHNAVLTEDAVRRIRTCGLPDRALAREYGVSATCIERARTGYTWKHVIA